MLIDWLIDWLVGWCVFPVVPPYMRQWSPFFNVVVVVIVVIKNGWYCWLVGQLAGWLVG